MNGANSICRLGCERDSVLGRGLAEQLRSKWSAVKKRDKPVLAGSGRAGEYDSHGVDCPFVFRHNGRFYMMHVGFDGIGYQTALAVSDNLLDWEFEAIILGRLPDSTRWDRIGAAGSWILLQSNDVNEVPTLRKLNGRYWMIYHAYPGEGYETGGACMGLAWSDDETLRTWHRLEEPVFTFEGGGDWEKAGLYKCCVIEHNDEFWMFYNAKGSDEWPWIEQTGIARSSDLRRWERFSHKPVMPVEPDRFYSQFYSDPCIRHDGQRWLNFGFGFDGVNAQGLLACSDDLIHWETADIPLLPTGPKGALDEIHAHKSSIVVWNGVIYHFYCACRPWREGDPTRLEVFAGQEEFRCIAVATGPVQASS